MVIGGAKSCRNVRLLTATQNRFIKEKLGKVSPFNIDPGEKVNKAFNGVR